MKVKEKYKSLIQNKEFIFIITTKKFKIVQYGSLNTDI